MPNPPRTHPWTPSTRQYRDERSPHTTTQPLRINDGRIYKPFPSILLNGDTTPGTIHHGRADITDYTVWHSGYKIAVDEARITAVRAPDWWDDWVGLEQGRELKVVVRKDVRIVPEVLEGEGECRRDVNVREWERKREDTRREEEEEGRERIRREGNGGRDSGYGSREEQQQQQKTTGVLEKMRDDGDYSIWSCC